MLYRRHRSAYERIGGTAQRAKRQIPWPARRRLGDLHPAADIAIVELGPGDVPDMLDLVARAEPGPFGHL